MIGAVGGLGFIFGAALDNRKILPSINLDAYTKLKLNNSLAMPIWIIWVVIGISLSWLSAPQDVIFTAKYTTSISDLQNSNFSSAWLISYVILAFAFSDAILDCNRSRKKNKKLIIFFSIVFVVIYLQLLRGDRESLPFVLGVMLVYFYWAKGLTQLNQQKKFPWAILGISIISLFVISMVVGSVRSLLADISNIDDILYLFNDLKDSNIISISNLLSGTWSGALLTPLSVAGDYIYGLLPLKLGKTYLDLFASLPPGFIADIIGYVRPIDASRGPAYEMRYGMGGTHAVVVPFMNFQIIGVIAILIIFGYMITRYEKKSLKKINVYNLSSMCTIVTVLPHWMWYGEKNIINALIILFILSIMHKISLLFSNPIKI